jgi:hypothetical protein
MSIYNGSFANLVLAYDTFSVENILKLWFLILEVCWLLLGET